MCQRCGVKMKEYLISVIGVCALCFIVNQVSFDSNKKYISFVCGLCALAVISGPIINALEWLADFNIDGYIEDESCIDKECESIFESYVKDRYLDEIKMIVKSDICAKYELDESCVEVYLQIVGEDLEKITLSLTGKGIFANTNDMVIYIENKYSCKAEMIIGG